MKPRFSKRNKIPIWVILFWIAFWFILSAIVDEQILLASPLSVVNSLVDLIQELNFWQSIAFTLLRLSGGFLLALVCAILFACISFTSTTFRQLIQPIMIITKSVPVASFIIVLLIWISSRHIAISISFIMVLPIIYTNVLHALDNRNTQLEEMSSLFQVSTYAKIRYIYIPQVLPAFTSACSIALGMCFKAGIAAEVIGLPDHSIGENLYEAKIYLNTPDLFAWTLVIVIMSFLFEKLFMKVITILSKKVKEPIL